MHLSLSPFLPMAPHHPEVQPPAGGKSAEAQTPQTTAPERAHEPDAEERESKRGLRVPSSRDAREAAHLDPTSAEYHELQELKTRDREVRAHEMAHLAAAGPHARGGPSYDYKRGADGRRYAVGGHVNIDTSAVPGNPEATLRKAEAVRRAALAPAEPSPQDRRIAADAVAMVLKARTEIAAVRREEVAARVEPGARERETEGSGDDKEPPVTEEQPVATQDSLSVRLAASGALPQGISAGSRIDTRA